jgi:hypothetical protein
MYELLTLNTRFQDQLLEMEEVRGITWKVSGTIFIYFTNKHFPSF